ncbi:MAG: VOC family protein [Pseudomonadota bacterium]
MRGFDHVVLPVADLAVARARYQELGFTVAPNGIHPFGTYNCCIFLANGGFLEPLALHDAALRDSVLREGENEAFVRGHSDYVEQMGAEGFSHLVLQSGDAAADRVSFEMSTILAGRTQFARVAENGVGASQNVSFDLTFAADERSPDAGFFTCHSLKPVEIDFSALGSHANTVVGVSQICTTSHNPHEHAAFVEAFVGTPSAHGDQHISADLGGTTWLILTPAGLAEHLGGDTGDLGDTGDGMRHQAIQFITDDMDALANALAISGLPFRQSGDQIIVPPGPGQGYWAIFEPGG